MDRTDEISYEFDEAGTRESGRRDDFQAIALWCSLGLSVFATKAIVENSKDTADSLVIERLKALEYAIRTSITVREDQEDDIDPEHEQEARRCGISVDAFMMKGDLLNAVQTALRAAEKAGARAHPAPSK